MKLPKRHSPEPHVPFISLADIAWQLIIFFLVTSSFTKNDALNIEMPNSSEDASQEQKKDTLTVQVSPTAILINDQPVEFKDLEQTLGTMLAGKTQPAERAVVMMATDDLTFQRDVEVKVAIKHAGGIVAMMSEDQGSGGGGQ